MIRMRALNLKKLKRKIKKKIRLRSPILGRRNPQVRNQKAKEEDERKNGFALGTEIIDLTVDLEVARDEGVMMFLHLRR